MRVFFLLQRAHSALFRATDRTLREQEGITASQNAVLFLLMREDGVPITKLAEDLSMGNSSLTALIDRMITLGFVRREKSSEDGRVMNIFIEEAGRELAQKTLPSVKSINKRLLSPFTTEEQKTIEQFLTHIAEHANSIVGDEKDR